MPIVSRTDIDVEVAHLAPLLLRGRRGTATRQAVIPITTRARVRHVPLESVSEPSAINGEGAGVNRGLRIFEGRLWRRVNGTTPWGTSRNGDGDAGPESLAYALANRPVTGVRDDLHALWLKPWAVSNQYGRNHDPAWANADKLPPAALALDLRAEAAAAMAARIASDLLHDGRCAWVAVPVPTIRMDGNAPVTCVVEGPVGTRLSFEPRGMPTDVRPYADYLARTERLGAAGLGKLRTQAAAVAWACSGLAADPLADVRRDLPRQVVLCHHAVASLAPARDPRTPEALARAAEGLLPFVARSSAGLLREADHAEALDRVAACAAGALAARADGRMANSHGMHALRRVLAYVELVGRPRALSPGAVPDADADSLDALAP